MISDLDLAHILNAQKSIESVIRRTPLEFSPVVSDSSGSYVFLKSECLQKTGSFKIRGAYNKISRMSDEERERGIVTASAGNHAQGVGYAAQHLGIGTRIYVPEIIPDIKLSAIRRYGAEVIVTGRLYDQAHEAAVADAERSGRTYIDAFDDPLIMAGQGTVGLEMLQEIPDLDALVIPVGGGGLICGIATAAKAMKPDVEIIGCQSVASCAMSTSLDENRAHLTFDSRPTIAEGLEGGISERTFQMGKALIDRMILVTEEEIRSAIRFLLRHHRLVVEGSGAVGVAALLQPQWSAPGKKVGIVLTGGNLDYARLTEIVCTEACTG